MAFFGSRIPIRGSSVRWLYLTLALLLLAGTVVATVAIRHALQPQVYTIGGLSIASLLAQHVPQDTVDALAPVVGEQFTQKADLLTALRDTLGDAAFAAHQKALEASIATHYCGPNAVTRPVYTPRDSRANPLHGDFGIEVVVPQQELPPVTTQLAFLPNGQGVVTLGKFGHVVWFDARWQRITAFQIPGVYAGGDDEGALGLAVDPGFGDNGYIFVSYVNAGGDRSIVKRFTLSPDGEATLASQVTILNLPKDPKNAVHGIGSLNFRDDGALLVQVGDPVFHAQVWGDTQGAVLAIEPSRGSGGGFKRPRESLWTQAQLLWRTGSREIVAKGLRSPFTGTLWKNRLIIGDVGGDGPWSEEEVNFLSAPGQNFGWSECRNAFLHADFQPPIIMYRRNDPVPTADDPAAVDSGGRAVMVGVVYEPGTRRDRYGGRLTGRLLYGDFFLGFWRGAKLSDDGRVTDDVFLFHQPSISSMRIGPDGYIYGTTAFGNRGLFRVVEGGAPHK